MADSAIGYWKQGKRQESISKFVEVLDLIDGIPFADDLKLRHLHATVRHCISWIHFEAKQERSEQLVDPRPGMCSNQEPHEGIKDHRIIDISAVWLLLYLTENAIGIDCGVGTRSEKLSKIKQPLFLESYKRTLEFEASLRIPPWDGVVPALVRMQEAIIFAKTTGVQEDEEKGWQSGEIPRLPDDYWNHVESWSLTYQALLAACINCLVHHPDQSFPVDNWRRELATLAPLPGKVAAFLDVLEGSPGDGSIYQEVGAGLVSLRAETVAVDTLWKISFRLLNAFEPVKRWAEKDIELLIPTRWVVAVDNQQFALQTPRLAVPAVKPNFAR